MKQEYIDLLTRAYTSICDCGHAADLHAHHNGHDHPGDTALGVCGCVLSGTQAALIAQDGIILPFVVVAVGVVVEVAGR